MPSIAEAKKGNEADHGNHWWNLKLDDGREAYGQFKKDLTVGEQVVEMYEKDGRVRVKRPDKEQGQASSNGRKDFDPDDPYWKSQNAMKGRSAAQDRALHLLEIVKAEFSAPPVEVIGEDYAEALMDWIRPLVDVLAADVERSGQLASASQAGASTGASETTRQEAGSHPQTAVRSQDDAAQPAPEVPVGAPTVVDVLKAKQERGLSPEDFEALVRDITGAESLQHTTPDQKAELMVAMEDLAA